MSATSKAEQEVQFPRSSANPVADWFIRVGKGILVGIGFILPGLSGGVLAVIFGIYNSLLSFLAHPFRKFKENILYFIPVGIGGVLGVLLFSKVVTVALVNYQAQSVSLFLGFVAGTFPSLYRKAGVRGRHKSDNTLMLVLAVAFAALMIFMGQSQLVTLTPSFGVWIFSGALIGLGVIVPGMSPSNFLLYFGLYDKMTEGISNLDFGVIIPLLIGLVACVLLLAKAVDYLFDRYYAKMYHFILGLVIGSTVAIIFTEVVPALRTSGNLVVGVLMSALFFAIGTVLSWLFSKVEDKYDPDKAKVQEEKGISQ